MTAKKNFLALRYQDISCRQRGNVWIPVLIDSKCTAPFAIIPTNRSLPYCLFQLLHFIDLLPGEFFAAKVAVTGGLLVDGAAEVQG